MDKISVIEELFQKKLGIVLKNAREIRKRTIQECATVIGVNDQQFMEFESGTSSPSLPQLEVLAFYLDLPIQHFFNSILEKDAPVFDDAMELNQFFSVRQKVIATRLKSRTAGRQIALASPW